VKERCVDVANVEMAGALLPGLEIEVVDDDDDEMPT